MDANGRPRATVVPVSRSCALIEAIDVPSLGDVVEGVTVLSRQLRVILCDNQRFLSNLVTNRAQWHPDHPLVWRFDKCAHLFSCFLSCPARHTPLGAATPLRRHVDLPAFPRPITVCILVWFHFRLQCLLMLAFHHP